MSEFQQFDPKTQKPKDGATIRISMTDEVKYNYNPQGSTDMGLQLEGGELLSHSRVQGLIASGFVFEVSVPNPAPLEKFGK